MIQVKKSISGTEATDTKKVKASSGGASRPKEPKASPKNRLERYQSQVREVSAILKQEITQRNQAEEALRESELRYHSLLDSVPCAILKISHDGKITFWNRHAEEVFGYQAAAVIGQSVFDTIVSETNPDFNELLRSIKEAAQGESQLPSQYGPWESESRDVRAQPLWIEWTARPVYNKDAATVEVLCFGIDRTARKKVEELVAQQAAEKAVATERSRLARELHDAVSQTLFSASLTAEVLPILWDRDQEQGRRRLQEIRQLTRGALAEMRMLLLELRPSALINARLGDLLTQLAEAVSSRMLIPVKVQVPECKLPVEVKLALYRIAQEALNNVVKHSGASQAEITLSSSPGQVELHVTDNGRGFDATRIPGSSLGMRIMRERAEAIGATFEIRSQPGSGTDIVVRLSAVPEEAS
jgi:PAS domain S-box-containing protein